jgi:hypothetical protein
LQQNHRTAPLKPLQEIRPQNFHRPQACSTVPAATAMAPGSPCPMQVDTRASAVCGPQIIQVYWLCCTTGTLNLLHSARSLPPHIQVNTRLRALLFCLCQEASLPIEYGRSILPTVPDSKRVLTPPSKSKNSRFPTEGSKVYNLLLCRWLQALVPKVHRSPVLHTAPPCRRVMFLLSKSWNPRSSIEWQSTTLLALGGLTPTVHRDPALPTASAGEALHPHQRVGTPAPSPMGEK